jgi:hypothetical protein
MHDVTKDAKSFAAVRVGDEPLVPPEVQKRGTVLEIALEAVARLGAMKRPKSRVLHRRSAYPRACSGDSITPEEH